MPQVHLLDGLTIGLFSAFDLFEISLSVAIGLCHGDIVASIEVLVALRLAAGFETVIILLTSTVE